MMNRKNFLATILGLPAALLAAKAAEAKPKAVPPAGEPEHKPVVGVDWATGQSVTVMTLLASGNFYPFCGASGPCGCSVCQNQRSFFKGCVNNRPVKPLTVEDLQRGRELMRKTTRTG